MNTAKLCKCNKCNSVFIDNNPNDQPELPIPNDVKNMVLMKDVDGSYFWGCSVCKTDDHLIDAHEL